MVSLSRAGRASLTLLMSLGDRAGRDMRHRALMAVCPLGLSALGS